MWRWNPEKTEPPIDPLRNYPKEPRKPGKEKPRGSFFSSKEGRNAGENPLRSFFA
jgi:hypothetical protein